MEEKKITAYKGYDENLCCRGFQYEIGKEYEQEGEIECCCSGFHACTNPFDVLNYYNANGKNRFCEVEQIGIVKTDGDDTKQSSSKIKIKAEIGMTGLFKAGVEWIKEKTDPVPVIEETRGKGNDPSGDYAQIGSIGDYVKISSSGYSAKIGSSGYYAKIGSSGGSAQIGSSGDYTKIDSTGEDSIICCAGNDSMVKARLGSWITLSEWKYSKEKRRSVPVCVKTEYVDGERIKADTWYRLVDGEFREQ